MNILSAVSLTNTFNKYKHNGDFTEVTHKRSVTIVISLCVKILMAIEYFSYGSCNVKNNDSTNFINFILLIETITLFIIIVTMICPTVYIAHSNRISNMEAIMHQDQLYENLLGGKSKSKSEYKYESDEIF